MPRPADDLAAFAAVARHRSFTAAAARLGVSPSALSHAVRGLEDRLGVRLLNRTTRSVAPTAAGARLLDRLGPALDEIAAAVAEAVGGRDRPAGTVRLNVPAIAATLVLAPAFGSFAAGHPDIRLDVVVDDTLSDVVGAGFDAGIRLGERLARDMIAVPVSAPLRMAVVAAPALLAATGQPALPQDLRLRPCLRFRYPGSGGLDPWVFERDGVRVVVEGEGPLVATDPDLCIAAACDGAGFAAALLPRVAPLIAAGRLVEVLADWQAPFAGLYLYHPSRRQTPPALRALIDHLRVTRDPAGPGAT